MKDRFHKSVQIPPEIERQYAEAALRVMHKHGVRINDLHALMAPDLKRYQQAENNVHYNEEGSKRMANQVAQKILEALNSTKH